MRIHLYCNPASGGTTDRGDITARLERHGATMTGAEEAERVVVSGGDGTIAQGAELAATRGVPLAVIPTGTANDFARTTGLPRDIEAAAELAVTGAPGPARELGFMDGRAFVNVAAAGLAPAAARRAQPLKRLLGPLAYPAAAVLAGLLDEPVRGQAGEFYVGEAWQVIVACSGAFGGGAEIDATDPGDGRLDLLIVPGGPRLILVARALRMRRGDLAADPQVLHRRVAELTLDVPARTPFNVDGELVEAGPEVRFTVTHGAFRLVAPSRPPVQ